LKNWGFYDGEDYFDVTPTNSFFVEVVPGCLVLATQKGPAHTAVDNVVPGCVGQRNEGCALAGHGEDCDWDLTNVGVLFILCRLAIGGPKACTFPVDFEWDEAKSEACANARRFNFDYAAFAFSDPNRIVKPDTRHDCGEERFELMGLIEGCL
jgi:hypothetical protein